MAELKLYLGALNGLASDGATTYPVLTTADSPAYAELELDGAARARLAPGLYRVEIRARAIEGSLSPRLALTIAGGGERHLDATEISDGVYRFAFFTDRAVASVSVELPDATRFVFVDAKILTDDVASDAPPRVRDALVGLARAIFSKTPYALRKRLLAPGRRAKWLQRVRKSTLAERAETQTGGRVLGDSPHAACDALRFDFENRLAAARGGSRFTTSGDQAPLPARVKAVAFYLPQFHPIPENDAWWGAGFTEWTNVAKAIPQFVGHDQPRLPADLGFYDLRTRGVMAKQAELARAHGVSAFCFHYYWFDGKRLLERPLDAFLADASIDIEFCLCWANENWTRRWDGDDAEILIAQHHSPENHERIFADLARYMDDARYIRVEGKPVLIVYRPDIIADASAMTEIWRRESHKRGWPGLYLIATNAFGFFDPKALGFDAIAEFPPHGIQARPMGSKLSWLNEQHRGKAFSYEEVARDQAQSLRGRRAAVADAPVFPGVMPGWDNEARRPGAGVTYQGATPEAYGAWLAAAVDYAERALPPDRRLVFINAWNEWAEGAYLEPDRAHGRRFLVETARAMAASR